METSLPVIQEKIDHLSADIAAIKEELREVRDSQKTSEKSRFEKAWDLTSRLALPLAVLIGGILVSLRDRVQYIESTRIPASEYQKQIYELRNELANGAPWMRSELSKMSATLDLLRVDLNEAKVRQIKIEAKLESVEKPR